MTIRRTVARVSMICLIPALVLAQDTPDAAPGASVLQVHDAPDQIIHVTTRIRHTTVIQLPPRENILDFIVGDSEVLAPVRRRESRVSETDRRRRQHQRRAYLRERPDLFVPGGRTRRPAASHCPRRS